MWNALPTLAFASRAADSGGATRLPCASGDRGPSGVLVSMQRDSPFPRSSAALRSLRKVAPAHAERPAIRGEPQLRTFQCDTQLGAPLGSPPPEHYPYLVQRDATPKVGASPVSWRIAVGKAGRGGALTRSGRARTAAAGPFPHPGERPTRRTRARQPVRLAVAATPRAVVAVHLRRLLPDPNGADAL
jgi:hypothetical protein